MENSSQSFLLSVVIPCHNEEGNIKAVYELLAKTLSHQNFEVIFVDDGSTDNTKKEILQLKDSHPHVNLVSFLMNAGHQSAIRAGLNVAKGEYAVTMDADLQHPPEYIPEMLETCQKGFDVVNMIRTENQKGFFKHLFSKGFYLIFNSISEVKIPADSSDFRIISKRVIKILNELPERNLVLRVIIPHLGFRAASLKYAVGKRQYGRNSYTFSKSLNLAYNTIINFTTFPLNVGFRLGWLISTLAFIYAGFVLYTRLFTGNTVPGYTDIMTSLLLLGGIGLIYLGFIGKYLIIILDHLKKRPEYLLDDHSADPKPQQPCRCQNQSGK